MKATITKTWEIDTPGGGRVKGTFNAQGVFSPLSNMIYLRPSLGHSAVTIPLREVDDVIDALTTMRDTMRQAMEEEGK